MEKTFYLEPILNTFKKKITENPIINKILEMISKADIDKLDFGLKKSPMIIPMLRLQMKPNIKTINRIQNQKPK